jgi:polyhydroxybutyrate depolymerase
MKFTYWMHGVLLFLASLAADAEVFVESMSIDGAKREWRLFVPERYDGSGKHALVLDFHGTGGTPEGQAKNSALTELAAEKGFLVVNPAGAYRRTPEGGLTWNVDIDAKGVDDVKFVRALIDQLKARYSIDPKRIYSTGFSGGARISSRLACDLSDVIAAIGAVGGIRFPDSCTPEHPVAILAIHSVDDDVNHFVHRSDSPAYWPVGVSEAVASWARYNQCAAAPTQNRISAEITKISHEKCRAGSEIVFYKLQHGGHTWPGSAAARQRQSSQVSESDSAFSATQTVWEFFDNHPKAVGR